MFTVAELIKITNWINKRFDGSCFISFVEGFEGSYAIIETKKDCRDGRQVVSIKEILSED